MIFYHSLRRQGHWRSLFRKLWRVQTKWKTPLPSPHRLCHGCVLLAFWFVTFLGSILCHLIRLINGKWQWQGPPPFQPTIIFYDGIFGCFTNFFSSKTSKFRHSVTKKRQLLGDFVPQTPTGALPLVPTGGLPSPDPLGPLLSHILNTPLASGVATSVLRARISDDMMHDWVNGILHQLCDATREYSSNYVTLLPF